MCYQSCNPFGTCSRFDRAVKRFITRRGYPGLMISDNATNFILTVVKSFYRVEIHLTRLPVVGRVLRETGEKCEIGVKKGYW